MPDIEGVTVRFLAAPVGLLPPDQQRAPCSACAFVVPADRCRVMRGQMVALGLPDCSTDVFYQEVLWEPA